MWSVRRGGIGEFHGPEILSGYRSPNAVREPRLGEVLRLPDGSGPWQVVDWAVADRVDAPGNVLVVQGGPLVLVVPRPGTVKLTLMRIPQPAVRVSIPRQRLRERVTFT